MIPADELAVMKRQTEAFIDGDYEMITILPRETRIPDGAGGWTRTPGPVLAPQKVRLIPQSDKVPVASTLEGRRETPEFILMAMPDADIQRYDRFVWKGKTWEVGFIHQKPEYELKGDVDLYVGSN